MFIKNQNKTEIRPFNGVQINRSGNIFYFNPLDSNGYHSIGDYTSLERCQEIMKEIQKWLEMNIIIYEMPEE
jgi:hypothetical protein